MIVPINNLINAHALNFVSAGIGNTLAFFFLFAWESSFHQLKILHILISQKRFCDITKSARIFDTKKSILWYQKIKFVTSKNRFSAKSEIFLISQNFDVTKSIFDITKSSLFCDRFCDIKKIAFMISQKWGFYSKMAHIRLAVKTWNFGPGGTEC